MLNLRRALVLTILATTPFIAPAGAATITERDVTYLLDTTGGLNNTVTTYDNSMTLPAGGSSVNVNISLKTGAYGTYFSASGGVSESFVVPPPGTSNVNGNIINNGSGGNFFFGYTTNNGPNFNASWTQSEVVSAFNALHFNGGGTNLDDIGGKWVDTVFITGDWSTNGLVTGGHLLNNLDSNYTITKNFIFTGHYTIFSFETNSFSGGSPNVDFDLFGTQVAAVPEISTWTMMLLGFAGVGFAAYRRRDLSSMQAI